MSTLVAEQRRQGLSQLRFTPFVEEQFRQQYAGLHYPRVRLLLGFGVLSIIAVLLIGIHQGTLSTITATFSLGIMLPLLVATMAASGNYAWRRAYQPLLTGSVLCVGLIVTSLTLRASLHGIPYYFAAEVAWLFVVWLVLGLHYWYAATAAVAISATYVWGLVHWNFGRGETLFECVLLLLVNGIGALCCFQLEATTRRAFRDKNILEDQADRDGLTGLYNRRAFDGYMERIWRQSRRDRTQITLMLIDVDKFKDFNDLYGHQAGDDALKHVAEVIAMGAQRPLDLAARYGGEEFALVLYGQDNDADREVPEQIRRKVEALAIPHAGSTTGGHLTVSVGVSIVTPGAERSMAGAIQMADEALYQAKEEGRNRVVAKESRLTHLQTGRFRASGRAARRGP